MARQFLFDSTSDIPPRSNIAPTQDVAIVRQKAGGPRRELAFARWGLVPYWAKDIKIGSRMINARCETVTVKPAFKSALARRRCLILADGYYEWQKIGGAKQPYHIRLADGQPFALAGLWESWRGPNKDADQPIETCTIITTDANEQTRTIHDRMPVILNPCDYDRWLDPSLTEAAAVEPLMRPYEGTDLVAVETNFDNASPTRSGLLPGF